MADGDTASTFAGWVKVLDSDELRLAYVGQNRAADLALKYGQLRLANATAVTASTGQGIGQRAVDLATGDEYRWNGTAWQLWTTPTVKTYTPTLTGITVGNGTLTGYYKMGDGLCHVMVSFTLGSTSAVTGAVTASMPVTSPSQSFLTSQVVITGGPSAVDGLAVWSTSTTLRLVHRAVSGALVVRTDFSASAPFTWATGHGWTLTAAVRAY